MTPTVHRPRHWTPKHIAQIAKRSVLSDNAVAVLVPILEKIVHWQRLRIREFFEAHGFLIQEWDKVRTDWVTLKPVTAVPAGNTKTI